MLLSSQIVDRTWHQIAPQLLLGAVTTHIDRM